jgi:SAM-dependent methyltransferase
LSTSNWQNISYNIDLVRKLNPSSILDIGIGFGRWGFLFREFLDLWNHGKYSGDWKLIIDGIEIHKNYIQDYHKFFYSNIYNADALSFLRNNKIQYDLINCGDVIEHLTKTEGKELIDLALAKSKYVLINIPIGSNWEQPPLPDNQYEEHKSRWEITDFSSYPDKLIKMFKDDTMRQFAVILLSSNKIKFENRHGKYFKVKNFMRNKLGLNKLVDKIEKRKR